MAASRLLFASNPAIVKYRKRSTFATIFSSDFRLGGWSFSVAAVKCGSSEAGLGAMQEVLTAFCYFGWGKCWR